VSDPLGDLRARLDQLEGAPVFGHADVLEDVHRRLVSELEALAGAGSVGPGRARRPA
jgi:hypothetical protein